MLRMARYIIFCDFISIAVPLMRLHEPTLYYEHYDIANDRTEAWSNIMYWGTVLGHN